MKVIEKGHIYEAEVRSVEDGKAVKTITPPVLTFINKEPGYEHDGTTTQEVLRILIDRTRHCNNCLPHRNNEQVIYHLRMALVMHEARALERRMEKGSYRPEYVTTGDDGHFLLDEVNPKHYGDGQLHTTELVPARNDWDRECSHTK